MQVLTIKERPIIFGATSVNAILEDRKSETRRVENGSRLQLGSTLTKSVTVKCPYAVGMRLWVKETYLLTVDEPTFSGGEFPDTVRSIFHHEGIEKAIEEEWIIYRADNPNPDLDSDRAVWKSPLFMPREFSRILLEITEIRVERLQEITEEGAIREGMEPQTPPVKGWSARRWIGEPGGEFLSISWYNNDEGVIPEGAFDIRQNGWSVHETAVEKYQCHWNAINGKAHPWDSNPWVWVIGFRRLP